MLARIDNFSPEEDTEFFGKKVGGSVCAAVDEYALFDFAKLHGLGTSKKKPQAYQVLLAGGDGEPAKLALVYSICGSSFKPEAEKINSDETTITDADSCSKMGANTDTLGNMYLLKDGACVQSFKNADFDATVEQ